MSPASSSKSIVYDFHFGAEEQGLLIQTPFCRARNISLRERASSELFLRQCQGGLTDSWKMIRVGGITKMLDFHSTMGPSIVICFPFSMEVQNRLLH